MLELFENFGAALAFLGLTVAAVGGLMFAVCIAIDVWM
jgi:hypothetical protein